MYVKDGQNKIFHSRTKFKVKSTRKKQKNKKLAGAKVSQRLDGDSRQRKGQWDAGELLALVAEGAGEAGEALAVACDVMARPGAVHALWARLAAAVPVEARRADCKRCQWGWRAGGWREDISQPDKRYIIMKRGKTRVIKGAKRKERAGSRRYKAEETRGDSEGRQRAEKSDFIVITSINLALEKKKKFGKVRKVAFMSGLWSHLNDV